MKYFRNTELAKLYNVSEKSVRNWIGASQEGKLDLQLYTNNGKLYVADTSQNTVTIKELVQKGRKYKNSRAYKIIEPTKKFYDLYNPKQIFDIITNLENYHELPRQYNYFDGGAAYWDKYTQRLATESTPNIFTSTLKLMDDNQSYIDKLLSKYKQVNVVDVGVGNALAIKNFLTYLLNKNQLGRYIAIDISSEMLEIAHKNIVHWFNGRVTFEGHELDFNYDRFSDLLIEEYLKEDATETVNVLFVLGGTLGNLRSPDGAFKVIHDSMTSTDILVIGQKLDTEATRRYFDFSEDSKNHPLAPQYKFLVDLLNIDESCYTVEMNFDPEVNARYLRIRLKMALSIKFSFAGGERIVDLNKDDTLLMWRYWHQTSLDVSQQLDRNSFVPLLLSHTEDNEYLLSLSRIKSERV